MLTFRWSRALAVALFAVSSGLTAQAAAQSRQLPVMYRDRPLVLPERTLRADAAIRWQARERLPNRLGLDVGGGGGIAADWEIGTTLIPLQLAPDTDYHNPSIYALYRLTAGEVEAGVLGQVWLPIEGNLRMEVGPPLLVRLGYLGRLDTGVFLQTTFGERTTFDLRVPAAVALQIAPQAFLGPELALFFPRFSDVTLMLGGFGGWTFTSGGAPLADLIAHMRWHNVNGALSALEILLTADLFFDI